jgi:8-oxo-dGTP pyrophosphatase MutT (NUDIX family)
VIGVIPRGLVDREIAHTGLSDLRVVDTMHERKALMADLSDGFVALPGGAGTLEELFEVWTWAQLGLHAKPCGFLNLNGYYNELTTFLDRTVAEGFLRPAHRAMLTIESDPRALLDRFATYAPPSKPKWGSADRVSRVVAAVDDAVDVVAWVCVREGRLLGTRTRSNDVFYIPGGKREPGESDWSTLAREVREELGLELRPETLSLVRLVEAPAHGYPPGTVVRMICYAADPIGDLSDLRVGAEVRQLAWLAYSDRDRCAPAARAVIEVLHARGEIG